MPLFYESAYKAACSASPPPELQRLRAEHFDEWPRLFEALSWLSDEQKCDAIYADWLCRLSAPGGETELVMRNHLLKGGALDANFLAELAQNADDASDGEPADFSVQLMDDWLLVCNNGRKVTARNLLGLSRFFVHFGSEDIHRLDDDTIGRFGIGFKSCYRIARQVLIETWDRHSTFAFRLPICSEDDAESHPDQERLDRLVQMLTKQGQRISNSLLRRREGLGYCTPEFLCGLPKPLSDLATSIERKKRGSLFCLHLHERGLEEVERHLSGGIDDLYRLCPLFLPNMRSVTLGSFRMEKSVPGGGSVGNSTPGVAAKRVTLTVTSPEGRKHHRFWRLAGDGAGDCWQIALAADSEFRLKNTDDPLSEMRWKDGAAYAFFPLGDVAWPLRTHLHIAQHTNLSRGNWNSEELKEVRQQMERAVSGMAQWLSANHASWHPSWSVVDLIERAPDPREEHASYFVNRLKLEARRQPLFRSLAGGFLQADSAFGISVFQHPRALEAWRALASLSSVSDAAQRLAFACPELGLGHSAAGVDKCKQLLLDATNVPEEKPTLRHQNVVAAALSIDPLQRAFLEAVLGGILLQRLNGKFIELKELARSRRSADLTDDWHELFACLKGWQEERAMNCVVFGSPIGGVLDDLAEQELYLPWDEVPETMADESAWDTNGERFWRETRSPCPTLTSKKVVGVLRVCSPNGSWVRVVDYWWADHLRVSSFHEVLLPPNSAGFSNAQARRWFDKLNTWNLRDAYEDIVEERLKADLPAKLLSLLRQTAVAPFALLGSGPHFNSRNELLPRWRLLVEAAENEAMTTFLNGQSQALPKGRKLVASDVPAVTREIVLWNTNYVTAPAWLDTTALDLIDSRRLLGRQAPVELVTAASLQNRLKREVIAKELLGRTHEWADKVATDDQLRALNELFREATGNWTIGINSKRDEVLRSVVAVPGGVEDQDFSGGTEHWNGKDRLPRQLMLVENLTRVCIRLENVKRIVVPEGDIVPIPVGDASEVLRRDARFLTLLSKGNLRYCRKIHVRWCREDQIICEWRDVDYARDDDGLLVSRVERQPDVTGYSDVLAFYLRYSNDASVQAEREQGKSPVAIYGRHRKRILSVFRRELVERVGYRVEHILRELLQNAESAYASSATSRSECPFMLHVKPAETDRRQITVEHFGRPFNEPDKDGNERPDLDRIIGLGAQREQTEEELGRFNRGFKSVFHVTEQVRIVSGHYQFSVRDLLIRQPHNPVREPQSFPSTQFTFECGSSEADAILGWKRNRVSAITSSSLIFLHYITSVALRRDATEMTWKIRRDAIDDRWHYVAIESPDGNSERYRVFESVFLAGRRLPRRTAVAWKLDSNGRPSVPDDAPLYLWFPTETSGPCGLLFNGDFEVAEDRLAVRDSSTNAAMMKEVLSAILDQVHTELVADPTAERWCAWAQVLSPRAAKDWVHSRFPDDTARLGAGFEDASKLLQENVPAGGRLRKAEALVSPTRLLRHLQQDFGQAWALDDSEWIPASVDVELSKLCDLPKYSLSDVIDEHRANFAVLNRMWADISPEAFRSSRGRTPVESREIEQAIDHLRGILFKHDEEVPPLPPPSLHALYEWWHNNRVVEPYTIDGDWWPILFDAEPSRRRRQERLQAWLQAPTTPDGRLAWYKILGLACLLSTARRVQQTQNFWSQNLRAREFWERSADGDFAAMADKLFAELMDRQFNDALASGEDAEYWRRVFYDLRKVHHLIYRNDFATVLLEAAENEVELASFLRAGVLPDQPSWSGVLGQSAGAPIFFLLRELRRLGIISGSACLFVCRPVRRVAAYFGLLDPDLVLPTNFRTLLRANEEICDALNAHDLGRELLKDFDLPLLHWATTQPQS